ncbi:hypothetical protein GCM10011399_37120 [Subtercola lobariae]|uniref:Uncharacterized protein n=1 Tax=Subtercola lobariae TaxID=1588641 RepID=A0A917BFK9_9MICO|nr:hypothetical protein GCM10011399_37120 [Subtercola lobariae]
MIAELGVTGMGHQGYEQTGIPNRIDHLTLTYLALPEAAKRLG